MREELFYEALKLLSEHEMAVLRESKMGLITVSRILSYEKVLGSKNALKALHHRDISSKSKKKRILYIDEKLLPEHTDVFSYNIIDNFVEVKNGSILRIRDLLKEKNRLMKATSEHDLKAKSALRSLATIYEEERKVMTYLERLDATETIYNFFRSRRIIYYNLTENGKKKLYNEYMSGQ